jgi:hypothetical protein
MDEFTTDYNCIYIDNRTTSNNWSDCVFYYKADVNLPSFTFGCEDYLLFAKERQRDENLNI